VLRCNRDAARQNFLDQLSAKRHFNLSHYPTEGHLGTICPWRGDGVRHYRA